MAVDVLSQLNIYAMPSDGNQAARKDDVVLTLSHADITGIYFAYDYADAMQYTTNNPTILTLFPVV